MAELAVLPATSDVRNTRRSLTSEQWRTLYDSASGTTKLVLDFGGRHGMRPQEARALKWDDVDLDAKTVSVVNQLDSYDELTETKTERSTRTIRLHDETITLLNRWAGTQAEQKQKADIAWTALDLVITSRWGTPINRNNQVRAISQLCEKHDIERIMPYELRHTAITHQIEAGHSVSQIADWAGTNEKMIYKHYPHKLRELIDIAPVDL